MRKIFSLIAAAVMLLCGTSEAYCDGSIQADTEAVQQDVCVALMEINTKQLLYGENQYKKVPVGTMAKLMTVLLTAEAIESGELSMSDSIVTSSHANSMQGAQIWLMPGEKMTVEELLKGVIIGNANDASVALAEAVAITEDRFVIMMNRRAKELGMHSTLFADCSGFGSGEEYSTAYDLALLGAELSKHTQLREMFTTWLDYLRDGATELVNSNELVRTYKGITGMKTGFSEKGGSCSVFTAERDGAEYAAVVLGADDKDYTFTRGKVLLGWAFSSFEAVTPEIPPEYLSDITVKDGCEKSVSVYCEDILPVIVTMGDGSKLHAEIARLEPAAAPVHKGQRLGVITVYYKKEVIYEVNLLAYEDVEKKSLSFSLCKMLKECFKL